MVLGLLDAADGLGEQGAARVIEVGLDWPDPAVRLAALKLLAAAGRQAEALERAEGDRAAHIRHWGATRRQGALFGARGELAPPADATVEPHRSQCVPLHSQPSLFA